MPIAASQTINKDGWSYNGLFPHRTGATRSGLGWIGKNCCLITEDFGPRVRLGTVLTNMDFEYGKSIEAAACGECDLCVKACPANALKGNSWHAGIERHELLDPKSCSEHMRSKYQHIGRGAVCGICIKSCPVGKKVLKK
jgi:epoxyqueuosine reductase QueG